MRIPFRNRALGAILAVSLVATACGGSGEGEGEGDVPEGPTVVVSSFNFNESTILAEIYAQALEGAGYPVERRLNLGNREVVKPALESGEISLVPEYIGTILGFLEGTPTADSEETWQAARDAFAEIGVTLLDYAPAQDKNGYVVTSETADELGVATLSDLQPVAGDMVFGGPPECPDRDFCLLGLQEVYGLEFAEFVPLDAGGPLTVAALDSGEIDLGMLFTTSGVITANDWVLLEDDMGLNPAENVAPAVDTEVVDAYGEDFTSLLDSVSEQITTEALTEMNERADIDGDDPAAIASDWLAENT
jgi:osmoprotectant transport system substrate-binding protein